MTDELLMKYLLKEANAREQALIEDWLRESSENQKQFDQIRFLWYKSTDLMVQETELDEEDAWARFKKKRDEQPVAKKIKAWNVFQFIAAASVIVITGISIWIFLNKDLSNNNIIARQEVLYRTLSDGSLLTVNKNTRLNFSLSDSGRLVKLREGEAFFKVAPDKNKPFIVQLGDEARVTVLGTSFNIKYREGNAQIIVETGLVKVEKSGTELKLRPGEKVEFKAKDTLLLMTRSTDSLYKYFRNKEFVIDNVPLQRVIEVLSDAYSAKIILEDKDMADLKLNVRFKEEPLDKILGIITETFGLRLEKTREGYILRKK